MENIYELAANIAKEIDTLRSALVDAKELDKDLIEDLGIMIENMEIIKDCYADSEEIVSD